MEWNIYTRAKGQHYTETHQTPLSTRRDLLIKPYLLATKTLSRRDKSQLALGLTNQWESTAPGCNPKKQPWEGLYDVMRQEVRPFDERVEWQRGVCSCARGGSLPLRRASGPTGPCAWNKWLFCGCSTSHEDGG